MNTLELNSLFEVLLSSLLCLLHLLALIASVRMDDSSCSALRLHYGIQPPSVTETASKSSGRLRSRVIDLRRLSGPVRPSPVQSAVRPVAFSIRVFGLSRVSSNQTWFLTFAMLDVPPRDRSMKLVWSPIRVKLLPKWVYCCSQCPGTDERDDLSSSRSLRRSKPSLCWPVEELAVGGILRG